MCSYCAVSSLESALSLIPHITWERKRLDGLEVCEYFVPWLIEASKEQWLGEHKIRVPGEKGAFLYHLVGIENSYLADDNYAIILSVQIRHKSVIEYEAFEPLFKTFMWSTEQHMHDCCTFTHAVENGKASVWHINNTNYHLRMGAEEHPELLAHILTIMMNKSGSSGFSLLRTQ